MHSHQKLSYNFYWIFFVTLCVCFVIVEVGNFSVNKVEYEWRYFQSCKKFDSKWNPVWPDLKRSDHRIFTKLFTLWQFTISSFPSWVLQYIGIPIQIKLWLKIFTINTASDSCIEHSVADGGYRFLEYCTR